MESFFHGKSSGIDPLVSFLNYPVMIKDDFIAIVDALPHRILDRFSLMDTGISRSTQLLVNWYKEKLKDKRFSSSMQQLKNDVDNIIEAFLSNDTDSFEKLLFKISEIQLQSLNKLIPDHLEDFWKYGLQSGKYLTKICGAGGGGYLLVYNLNDGSDINMEMIPLI